LTGRGLALARSVDVVGDGGGRTAATTYRGRCGRRAAAGLSV